MMKYRAEFVEHEGGVREVQQAAFPAPPRRVQVFRLRLQVALPHLGVQDHFLRHAEHSPPPPHSLPPPRERALLHGRRGAKAAAAASATSSAAASVAAAAAAAAAKEWAFVENAAAGAFGVFVTSFGGCCVFVVVVVRQVFLKRGGGQRQLSHFGIQGNRLKQRESGEERGAATVGCSFLGVLFFQSAKSSLAAGVWRPRNLVPTGELLVSEAQVEGRHHEARPQAQRRLWRFL